MITRQLRTTLASSLVAFSLAAGLYARQPISEIAGNLGKHPAELRLPPLIQVAAGDNLQAVLNAAPAGATITLAESAQFSGSFTAPKPVKIVATDARITASGGSPALTIAGDDVEITGVTFDSAPGARTNDLVVIRGANTHLQNVIIEGNGATRRGIAANGRDMVFDHIQIKRIGRVGQETQAVAIWDGTGLTIRDSFLEAGSIPFLSGGAVTAMANHVPADILIERSTLTHPLEWRGQGYGNKNAFELKNAKRVILRDSMLENVWVEGQTGYGIQLTATQAGSVASPETTVEDVLIEHNTIQNVGSGVNILGFSQHQPTNPTQRGHNFRFLRNTFVLSRAKFGGHGSLMQLGWEPADILWEDNTVTQDGDAFIRAADSKPITGFVFRRNSVNKPGTYGVFTPLGSRGARFLNVFPSGVIEGNTFTGANSIFRANFPSNTWQ